MEEKKVGEIEQALAMMDSKLMRVNETLERLEDKIGPIVRSIPSVSRNDEMKEPGTQTGLGGTLARFNRMLDMSLSQMDSIINRVEL